MALERDEKGRLLPGQTSLNPSGRPKAFREYQEWLTANALDKAKDALLACLQDPDGRVRMLAVKEVGDRLFGRAPQAITDPDGKPILSDLGERLAAIMASRTK
jgi:hypothetical protein